MSSKSIQNDQLKLRKEGKKIWLIGELLYRAYGLSKGRRYRGLIRNIALHLEGGGHYSCTIRRIFSFYHKVDIGMYTKDPCYCINQFPAGTKIGRYTGIYYTVQAFNGNHPANRKSTHAFFFNPKLGYAKSEHDITRGNLTIGNDVCIYHNVIILPSVRRIGDGAIIGAGAIVTKDVPDFAVVIGQPAKVVKYRFSEETRHKIKASKWWDKSIEELEANMDDFIRPLEDEDNEVQKN